MFHSCATQLYQRKGLRLDSARDLITSVLLNVVIVLKYVSTQLWLDAACKELPITFFFLHISLLFPQELGEEMP